MIDIVVEKKLPKFIKVTFFVLPHPMLGYKTFKKERLIANDFLQIRKVIEHVYEKVMGSSETGSSAGSPTGDHHHHGHSQVRAKRNLFPSIFHKLMELLSI